MGATVSSPLVPPALLDSEDDSEDTTSQLDQSACNETDTNNGKADDISIVFVDDDDDDDENDLYYNDRDSTLCTDQYRCFGVPFLSSIHPPLFTMKPLITPIEAPPFRGYSKGSNNNEENDEDPRDGIEYLQQELKAVDAIYNHDDDDDVDSEDAVETLQRELQQAEENYVASRKNTPGDNNCDNSQHTLLSDGEQSQKSSSFINLQQFLFSSDGSHDEDNSCRIVEIYETRTTQLKPRLKSDKEHVSLERTGVPFRKCRDPSCSCHRPTTKSRDERSRNRLRNTAIIERYHANNNDHDEYTSSIESQRRKRRNALHRLQKQSEKLLAMEKDGDDEADLTAGSPSTSSLYSGYSIRSDCQINRRKNQFSNDNQNTDRGHTRERSLSVDYEEGGMHDAFSKGRTRTVMSTISKSIPLDTTAFVSAPSLDPISRQISASTGQRSYSSNNSNETKLTNKQSIPPPLPSAHSFGGSGDPRHETHPLSMMQSPSSKQICLDSFAEDTKNVIARRCRSEDFIDGSSSNLGDRPMVNVSGNEIGSISSSTVVPYRRNANRGANTKEEDGESFLGSPTCIMEEIHLNESYQRSRTIQHQPHDISKQSDRQIKHHEKDLTIPTNPPVAITRGTKSRAGLNFDDRNDKSYLSHLYYEREQSLKEYRKLIRFLQNQEKIYRRRKTANTHMTLNKSYRKKEKRRQQKLQQREFERSMQLAGLYHNMGLIHYQQARYDTARHVLQCGVDALIAHRASSVPYATAFHDEATDPFYEDYFDPYSGFSSSRVLPILPTLDEAAPHLANPALLLAAELVLAQGKIFAAQGLWNETKQSSGKVLQWSVFQKQRLLGRSPSSGCRPDDTSRRAIANSNRYWKDWGPTTARAQVLFARCFERERRPDVAMGYYQEALLVQKSVLGPGHFQAADTLYRIGNLHAASGMLGLAGHCYEEALCLYRLHKSRVTNGSRPGLLGDQNSHYCSAGCITADEATVLAGLGWIFLVQSDPATALMLTNQALDGMVHSLGPSHKNVLLLKHQLACIHSSLASSKNPRSRHCLQDARAYSHYEMRTGGSH